jgi:hypothetical protein
MKLLNMILEYINTFDSLWDLFFLNFFSLYAFNLFILDWNEYTILTAIVPIIRANERLAARRRAASLLRRDKQEGGR